MASEPPRNLDELRSLYIDICSGNHKIRLTNRSQCILKRMLDAPNETATKSISEIARESGVNISSITRLSQKLSFDGFTGLKTLFRQNLKEQKSFYSQQVKKFLRHSYAGDNEKSSLLQKVVQDEWSNVMLTVDSFDDQKFATLINLVVEAERILVIGLRSSYPLAYYLSLYLNMIRDHVLLAGKAGHTLAEDLSLLRPQDLMIAIGSSPYTRDTVEACRVVRRCQVKVAAITDSRFSPLANEADNFIIASIAGTFFFTPVVASFICIETLLSALVKKLGPKAIERLNQTELFLDKLKIEIMS